MAGGGQEGHDAIMNEGGAAARDGRGRGGGSVVGSDKSEGEEEKP